MGRPGNCSKSSKPPESSKARALDVVDLLVWVYRDQRADQVDRLRTGRYMDALRGGRDSMTAVIGRKAAVGCRIDGGGYASAKVDPAAEAAHELVERIGKPFAPLLVQHGRLGEPPPGYDLHKVMTIGPAWRSVPRYLRIGSRHGPQIPDERAVRSIYDANRNIVGCKLELSHEPSFVEELREDYRVWYAGLVRVVNGARRQGASLPGLRVTGPRIPAEPWALDDGA